jgi:hypothetical protein
MVPLGWIPAGAAMTRNTSLLSFRFPWRMVPRAG